MAAACLLLAGGCSQVSRPEQVDQAERLDVDTFLHEHLPALPIVTVGEAYRSMLVLADGDDPYSSFAQREEALLTRGIIRLDWKLQREQAVDRGTIAYMVCKILGIKGGINRAVFGELGIGDRRYALREMVYQQVMAFSPPYRYITGAELIDVVGKADRLMAEKGLYEQPPADLRGVLETSSQP